MKLPETYARIPARTLCGAIREPDQSRPRVRHRLLDAGSEAASDGASAHKGPSFVHASPARSTAERNAVGESAPAVVEESHAVTDASRRWRLIAIAAGMHGVELPRCVARCLLQAAASGALVQDHPGAAAPYAAVTNNLALTIADRLAELARSDLR